MTEPKYVDEHARRDEQEQGAQHLPISLLQLHVARIASPHASCRTNTVQVPLVLAYCFWTGFFAVVAVTDVPRQPDPLLLRARSTDRRSGDLSRRRVPFVAVRAVRKRTQAVAGGGGTLREAGGHYPGGGGRNRARAVDDRVNVNPRTGFRSTASEDRWPSHAAAVPRQTATQCIS
jgi:hypothetical protein